MDTTQTVHPQAGRETRHSAHRTRVPNMSPGTHHRRQQITIHQQKRSARKQALTQPQLKSSENASNQCVAKGLIVEHAPRHGFVRLVVQICSSAHVAQAVRSARAAQLHNFQTEQAMRKFGRTSNKGEVTRLRPPFQSWRAWSRRSRTARCTPHTFCGQATKPTTPLHISIKDESPDHWNRAHRS